MILITGSTGLLGQSLVKRFAPRPDVVGVSRHPAQASLARHETCDLTDADQTRRLIERLQPSRIIHAQALSDADEAEQHPELAWTMNVGATQHLIDAIRGTRTRVVALSTDYVFDGAKQQPYTESDTPHPLSVYGRSKLEAERVALSHPWAVVVRTSTLFGEGRMNFCDRVAARVTSGQTAEAFADQITSPAFTDDLAEAIAALGDRLMASHELPQPTVYHMTNAGAASRVMFARRVAEILGCSQDLVVPIPMAAQQRPAPRPRYSALATEHPANGRIRRSWEDALQAYLRRRYRSGAGRLTSRTGPSPRTDRVPG